MTSIIIPTYNNLQLFKYALESVLKQKEASFEIIVTDDSTNNDIELYCSQIKDSRIIYVHNKPSKGAIANWNSGLSLVKGENVIVLHHDESFISDDFLYRIDNLLTNNDIVIHNKLVKQPNGVKKELIPEFIKKIFIRLKYPILAVNVIGPCACIAFKKEKIESFDERLHWLVDCEWYFRLFKQSRNILYVSSKEILSRHNHEGQITNNIDIERVYMADSQIISKKYNSYLINILIRFGHLMI